MPINWNSIWPRQRTMAVAATGNPQVLAALWCQPGLGVREARTVDGLHDLLGEARLVILDNVDLAAGRLDGSYIATALARGQIPHTDSACFPADLARWLGEAAAFAGQIRSLPRRLMVFTSLASGGVGKTTFTTLMVTRRTRLPVAIVELAYGASCLLAVLDGAGFRAPPVDAYALAAQDAQPGVLRGLTVAPIDGLQGALFTGDG